MSISKPTGVRTLISAVNNAEQAICDCIESENEPDDSQLRSLDQRFQSLFAKLLSADVVDPIERYERVEYLMGLIQKEAAGSEYLANLTSLVLQDFRAVLDSKDTEEFGTELLSNPLACSGGTARISDF